MPKGPVLNCPKPHVPMNATLVLSSAGNALGNGRGQAWRMIRRGAPTPPNLKLTTHGRCRGN